MFVKLATITLLAFVATAQGGKVWNSFSAKWSPEITSDSFYYIPPNLTEAKNNDWTSIPVADTEDELIGMGYKNDTRYVVIYNATTGVICGLQFGIPVQDMVDEGVTFDYTHFDYWIRKDVNGVDSYTVSALFYEDEETDTRRIWAVKKGGVLREFPTTTAELTATTAYERKACLPLMGMHYYEFNRTTTYEEYNPWALLTFDDVNIVGIDVTAFGWLSVMNNRNWTDPVPAYEFPIYIPTTPQWLQDDLIKFSFLSSHLWFRNTFNVTCDGL